MQSEPHRGADSHRCPPVRVGVAGTRRGSPREERAPNRLPERTGSPECPGADARSAKRKSLLVLVAPRSGTSPACRGAGASLGVGKVFEPRYGACGLGPVLRIES